MALMRCCMILVFTLFAAAGNADELIMKNGSRLVGTLVSADENSVVFNTPFADDITINQDSIETIITEQEVTLLMQDGAVYRDKKIVTQDEDLIVFEADQRPIKFDVLDIKMINPEPWRLGEGYKWFGEINAALKSERGNTDSDETDIELESVWRSLEDRYTIRGLGEVDKSNGDKTKDEWKLRNKYDRFSKTDPDNYYGVQAAFEHKEFADLDLRTIVGPYVGRQFFETKILAMQGEVGIVYVDEQFDEAEDDNYWGSNWELRLISGIIPNTELYLNQDGILNFSDTENIILNTTVGIGLPLIFGFKVAAEAKYEYDGGAVDDVEDTDRTYNLKFGYAW
jgi:putative salt-induced outer membrane protein YdiY